MSRHSCARVDGDPGDLAVQDLAFARVQAGAHAEAEVTDAFNDGTSAGDGASGPVEAREESVPGRVDLDAAKARELPPHKRVVPFEQLPPGSIAQLDHALAGLDDVREQNGRQHAIGLGLVPGAFLPSLDEEALDLVDKGVGDVAHHHVPGAGKLDEPSSCDLLSHVARPFHR